ncbi:MAG: hypothetical protein ACFFC1_18755 [Promethearchaeota archaeon]
MSIRIYFVFVSFEQFLPAVLFSLYLIVFNVFLLRSSLENEREFPYFSRLKTTSIINIVLAGVIFFLPYLSISTPYIGIEEAVFIAYSYIFRSLIYTIPQIFTMGVILFVIGSKYKSQIGPFLMYCGIFWMVFFTWASISLYYPQYENILLPPLLNIVNIITEIEELITIEIVLGLGFIFNILGYIFFMIHSYSNSDKNLKIAGFAYIIGAALMGLGRIPSIFHMFP